MAKNKFKSRSKLKIMTYFIRSICTKKWKYGKMDFLNTMSFLKSWSSSLKTRGSNISIRNSLDRGLIYHLARKYALISISSKLKNDDLRANHQLSEKTRKRKLLLITHQKERAKELELNHLRILLVKAPKQAQLVRRNFHCRAARALLVDPPSQRRAASPSFAHRKDLIQ